MHRIRWSRTAGVALVAVALAAATALAQGGDPADGPMADGFGPPGMGPPHGPPPPFMEGPPLERLEQLNLTAAQRTKIAALRDDAERKAIRTEADLRIAELDLRKLVEADNPDAAAVDAAIDRVGGLRTQLHKLHVTTMLAVRATLTAEQRTKLRQLRDSNRDERAPSHRGRGGL